MIPIPAIPPAWIVAGIVVLTAAGYAIHCEHAKGELSASVSLAKQQAAENAKQALRDVRNKERSDEENDRRMARLRADVRRLRDASPSFVPAPVSGASDPDRACFDRAELDSALRGYRAGIVGLLEEGAAAVEGLDTAKAWEKSR